jgi:AcrR family transcriptional regulator
MGIVERRAREKEALRGQILAAATELFLSEGLDNVSIRRIADKIEYAPSTIYLYFKDKESILQAICVTVFQELTARLREVTEENLPPLESLRKGCRTYIEAGMEHPKEYQLVFGQPWGVMPENQPCDADAAGMESYAELHKAIVRCMDAGVIRQEDPDILSQSIWMAIHGVTHMLNQKLDVPHFPWAASDAVVERSLDLIFDSLRVGV